MQIKIFLTSLLFPIFTFAQNCVYVDSVYNTAKLRELGTRDIRFGVKQIVEDELSEKYNEIHDVPKEQIDNIIDFLLPEEKMSLFQIIFKLDANEFNDLLKFSCIKKFVDLDEKYAYVLYIENESTYYITNKDNDWEISSCRMEKCTKLC